jgi:hypothetical protein
MQQETTKSRLRRWGNLRVAGAITLSIGLVAATLATRGGDLAGAAPATGSFVAVSPVRVADTRTGPGPVGTVGAGGRLDVRLTGVAGIPTTGVAAVVANLTAVAPTQDTWLVAYPSGASRPAMSSLNVSRAQTNSNQVVVAPGTSGLVSVYNFSGAVDVVVDVVGWFPAGGVFTPSNGQRVVDTRANGAPLANGGSLSVPVAGNAGVPATGVTAVAVNVTAVDGSAPGWLAAWPSGQSWPGTSAVNYQRREAVSNLAFVPLGSDGKIAVRSGAASTHVVVDVVGWFTGSTYRPVTPTRLLDSRSDDRAPLSAGSTVSVPVLGRGGVPATGVDAVVFNLTSAEPLGDGWQTVAPGLTTLPKVSNLNYTHKRSIAHLQTARVGTDGTITIGNYVGRSHIVVDILGWFPEAPPPPPPTTTTTTTTTAIRPTTTAATTTTTTRPATTTTASTTTTTTPPPPPSGVNKARPFSATSPWNTPTPAGTQWFDTPALHQIAECSPPAPSPCFRHWWVSGLKVWWAKPTDPLWTFQMPDYIAPAWNRNRPAETFQFRAPDGLAAMENEDKAFVVVNEVTGDYVEVWQANVDPVNRIVTGTPDKPGWARGNAITGPGAGTLGGKNDGVRATNFSLLGGLITSADLAAGKIDHALVVALTSDTLMGGGLTGCTYGQPCGEKAWIAPATAWDAGWWGGPIKNGSRIGVPAGVPKPSGLSPLGSMVFDALQKYGAFVGDFAGGPWPMFSADYGTLTEQQMKPLFAYWEYNGSSDMEKIAPLLRVADYQP